MKYVKSDIKLKIVGEGPELKRYKKITSKYSVNEKIDFCGKVSEKELLDLYANTSCVVYLHTMKIWGLLQWKVFYQGNL